MLRDSARGCAFTQGIDCDRFLRLVEHVERAINGEVFYPNDHPWNLWLQGNVYRVVTQVRSPACSVLISASAVSFSRIHSVKCGDCDDAISSSSCSATRC